MIKIVAEYFSADGLIHSSRHVITVIINVSVTFAVIHCVIAMLQVYLHGKEPTKNLLNQSSLLTFQRSCDQSFALWPKPQHHSNNLKKHYQSLVCSLCVQILRSSICWSMKIITTFFRGLFKMCQKKTLVQHLMWKCVFQ